MSTESNYKIIISHPDTTASIDLSERKEELEGLARKYLKSQKQLLTEPNMKNALRVLAQDILPRGMQLQSTTDMKKLEPFYKAGLNDREALRKEAAYALSLAFPLALPTQQVAAVERQLSEFSLTPNITETTELVQTARARQAILPDFANQAIEKAKTQFPKLSLDFLQEKKRSRRRSSIWSGYCIYNKYGKACTQSYTCNSTTATIPMDLNR